MYTRKTFYVLLRFTSYKLFINLFIVTANGAHVAPVQPGQQDNGKDGKCATGLTSGEYYCSVLYSVEVALRSFEARLA